VPTAIDTGVPGQIVSQHLALVIGAVLVLVGGLAVGLTVVGRKREDSSDGEPVR
jgi:hypothetical protein